MVKRSSRVLPLIAITAILLIQFGPISELNITPTALLSEDSNECLTFQNVSHNYNYSEPIQYSFNITADLVNNCAEGIMYPSTLILNDTSGVDTSADANNWRYLIEAGGSYPVSWQVDWSIYIPVGTIASFELHPTRDNCQENCSQSQSYSQNVSIALGPVDVNACYGVSNITHDYNASLDQGLFNLTAELTNNCWGGDIHYPAASMYNDTVGVTSTPPEGSTSIGQSAYMIFSYNSTFTNWQIYLDTSISNGTNVTFSIQPLCSFYTWSNQYYTSNYMQDCDITPLNPLNLTIQIGVVEDQSSNQTGPSGNESGNNTEGNMTQADCEERGGNWTEAPDRAGEYYCDFGEDDRGNMTQADCEERGGNWTEAPDRAGEYYCDFGEDDRDDDPRSETGDITQADCEERGGNWVESPDRSGEFYCDFGEDDRDITQEDCEERGGNWVESPDRSGESYCDFGEDDRDDDPRSETGDITQEDCEDRLGNWVETSDRSGEFNCDFGEDADTEKEDADTKEADTEKEDADTKEADADTGSVPGFGFVLVFTASLAAAVVATRGREGIQI